MAEQVPFRKFLPVALMNGALSSLWILASGAAGLAAWPAFLAWSLWYTAGPIPPARTKHFKKNFVGSLGGIVSGLIIILAGPWFSAHLGSTFGLPILVGLVVTGIILLELTDLFELASSYFFALSGFIAYVYGGFGTGTLWIDAGAFGGLLSFGFFIGWLSDVLAYRILAAQGLKEYSQQQTIFDKET